MQTTEAKYYVYEWIRPDYNEAYYVGKGSGDRACYMVRPSDSTNEMTAELIKNGIAPEIRIIARFVNEDSALEFEKERIAFLKPLGFLTNEHPGGKQPPSWKGRSRSEETRKLQGLAKMGDLNPMKQDDVVAKMTASKLAFFQTDAGKSSIKQRSAKLIQLYETPQGKKILECMGAKVSAAQSAKGVAHHAKRPEVREKHRLSKLGGKNPAAKAVVEINSGLEFPSASTAAKHFGVGSWVVQTSAKNNWLTKTGLKFNYLQEKESL